MATKVKAPKARKRKDRAKQTYIPGTEPVSIKAIDTVLDDYLDKRDLRMAYLNDEVRLKGKLLDLMKQHELTEYQQAEYVIKIDATASLSVKRKKEIGLNGDE